MYRTIDNITIYNSYYDSDLGYDRYLKTTIRGVVWTSKRINTVTDKGLLSADTIIIRVPTDADTEGKTYLKPKDWAGLPSDEKVNYWTISALDKIVRGITDFEVTGAKGAQWADIEKKFNEVATVTGWTDNRESPLSHIRIDGR